MPCALLARTLPYMSLAWAQALWATVGVFGGALLVVCALVHIAKSRVRVPMDGRLFALSSLRRAASFVSFAL
jgi:hypothetical protein